jgi:streptogramin lyase
VEFDSINWITYDTINKQVSTIAADSHNNIWFGTHGAGVYKFNGIYWNNYQYPYYNNIYVSSLAIDDNDNKWFGTFTGGVMELNDTTWINYTSDNGLIYNAVTAVAIDVLGNLWFGTYDHGISMFDGSKWTNYNSNFGTYDMQRDMIRSVAVDSCGNVWFGTYHGVLRFDGNNWSAFTLENGLSGDLVHNIAIDKQGNKWFRTDGGVSKMEEDPYITISTSLLNIPDSSNSTATFNIISNTSWNIVSNQSWLTLNKASGSNFGRVTVTASANQDNKERTATLTISGDGVTSKTILVIQAKYVTGIENISDFNIQLYPLPVKDKLIISFSQPFSQASVVIYSLDGIQIYSSKIAQSITEVNMSGFVSGFYLVRIDLMDKGILTKKIIRQ